MKKGKIFKVINIFITMTFLFNMTAFQGVFLAFPLQAKATPDKGAVCPAGDVKYEIDDGYEYNDGSANIWGDENVINWAAKLGYKITSVCIKIGGPGGGSLKNPDPKAGKAGPYDHGISHIVIKTDKCHGRCEPDLQISKSDDPDPVLTGEDITYTINWSNEGNAIAWMTNIVDELPDEVTFVNAYPGGIYVPADHKVIWWLGPVLPDASGTKTLIVNVEENTSPGTILNEVQIDSLFTDPVSDEEETTVEEPACDLRIRKSVDINNANPGETVEYTIEYKNYGTDDCTGSGVIVADPLDDYLTYVEDSRQITIYHDGTGDGYSVIPNYNGEDQIRLYNVRTVSPGEFGVITLEATIDNPMPCYNTDVNNKAVIWSVETDKIWSNRATTDVYQGCGSLRVEKEVVEGNATPDQFGFRIVGWLGEYTYPEEGEDYVIFEDLLPDTYSVEETTLPNYNQTSSTCDVVDVVANQQSTCEFHNTRDTGTLTIIKHVDDGTAIASDWTMNVNGPQNLSFSGAENPGITNLVMTGDYQITETGGPANYTLTYSEDCDQNGNVTVGYNETKTCTLTNTRDTGTLTVIKHVNGGTAVASNWTMGVSGPQNLSFSGVENPGTSNTVVTGNYQITEIGGPANYTLTYSGNCDVNGNVTVGVNEVKTCTLTNTYSPPPQPGVSLTKTVTSTVGSAVLNYQLVYQNTGNITLTNVQVLDDYPQNYVSVGSIGTATDNGDKLTWSIGSLAPGGTATINYATNVKNTTPENTTILNTASITSDQTSPVNASATTQTPAQPNTGTPILSIDKSVSDNTVTAGENLTYSIVWTAGGTGSATNVVITDPLPENTTFVSADSNGVYDTAANTVTWNLGTKSPNDSGTVTLTVATSSTAINPTIIVNTATINSSETDPVSDNISTTAYPITPSSPLLQMTKDVDVEFANPDDIVTYTVVVTNYGGEAATNLTLDDVLPSGFTFVDGGGTTKTFNLDDLASGDSVTKTYEAKVGLNTDAGNYINTATVQADNHNPISAQATLEVRLPTVLGEETTPSLDIKKEVNVDFANPGNTIEYTVTITNTGDAPATNAVLNDLLPNGFTFLNTGETTKEWLLGEIQPNETKTVTYSVTIAANVAAGTYENTAKVKADNLDEKTAKAPVEVRTVAVLGELTTSGPSAFDYLYYLLGAAFLSFGIWILQRKKKEEAAK